MYINHKELRFFAYFSFFPGDIGHQIPTETRLFIKVDKERFMIKSKDTKVVIYYHQ